MKWLSIRFRFYGLNGLHWGSVALLSPLFVLVLMDRGLSLAQVGLWSGLNAFTVMSMEIPTGGLADLWGRGRVFALSQCVSALGLASMAFLPGIMPIFAGAFFLGLGRALSSGSLEAWFVDALKQEDSLTNLEKAVAGAESLSLGSLALGSFLGGLLPRWLGTGFFLPIVISLVLKWITCVLTLLWVKDTPVHDSSLYAPKGTLKVGTLWESIRNKEGQRLIPLMMSGALLALGTGVSESFWQPRFVELGGNTFHMGILMALCFGMGAFASAWAPTVSNVLGGHERGVVAYQGLLVAGLLLMSMAQGTVPLAMGMLAVYGGAAGAGVPRRALFHKRIPDAHRATMLSVDSLTSYAGFGGVALLGFVAKNWGIPWVWGITSILVLVWMYPGWAWSSHRRTE